MKKFSCAVFVLGFALVKAQSIFAQVQGQWATVGSMQSARELNAQVPLAGGKILSIGGLDSTYTPLASSEVYSSGAWKLTGSMAQAREQFPAVLLVDGKILVSGGVGTGGTVLAGAELYDPNRGNWSSAGSLSVPSFGHTATLLKSGKVSVAGGCTTSSCSGDTAVSELYDPSQTAGRSPAASTWLVIPKPRCD